MAEQDYFAGYFASPGEVDECPRCFEKLNENADLNATCRIDDETMLCSDCGTEQALEPTRFRVTTWSESEIPDVQADDDLAFEIESNQTLTEWSGY